MDIWGYCFKCRKKCKMGEPLMKVKWRNRKSKTGLVEAWKGRCESCNIFIYKIIGKG